MEDEGVIVNGANVIIAVCFVYSDATYLKGMWWGQHISPSFINRQWFNLVS